MEAFLPQHCGRLSQDRMTVGWMMHTVLPAGGWLTYIAVTVWLRVFL